MQLRSIKIDDLAQLDEIDGTVEATHYIHLERSGEGTHVAWRLEERQLREKLVESRALTDESRFLAKQIASGTDEGIAVVAEHEKTIVALMLAQAEAARGTMVLRELRVDYDFRRQGLGTAMVFQLIQAVRDLGLRAVMAETRTNNLPAAKLLAKCGFDLAGLDTHRDSNHDLVKEAATLFWYAALD
jgi:RimJ/RimL family protein N-acetyltransferase